MGDRLGVARNGNGSHVLESVCNDAPAGETPAPPAWPSKIFLRWVRSFAVEERRALIERALKSAEKAETMHGSKWTHNAWVCVALLRYEFLRDRPTEPASSERAPAGPTAPARRPAPVGADSYWT